jgi:hypothetical protein
VGDVAGLLLGEGGGGVSTALQHPIARFRKVTTRQAIRWASYAFVAAFLLEAASDDARWLKVPLELTAITLFHSSYWIFWILLILAPFRPHDAFTLRGECKTRRVNVGIALPALAAVHVSILAMIISVLA